MARTSSRASATNSRPPPLAPSTPSWRSSLPRSTCSTRSTGKPDDWYLTDFDLGDDLLDAKESLIDPIQAFLNGPQRDIYDEAAAFLTTHSSNLSYLPAGSDEAVRNALVDPNAFRGNRMAQLKQATDKLRTQIDAMVASNRTDITTAIEGRKAELVASAYYAKATTAAQESVLRKVDQTISRVGSENQIALIRELGASFEAERLPGAARSARRLAARRAATMTRHLQAKADRIHQDRLGRRRHRRT